MGEYPRFSHAEYERRRAALGEVMRQHDVDHLLIVTDHRAGNAPQWVTGWPGTVEAYVIFKPGERMTMHVEWYNHVPLACAGASTAASTRPSRSSSAAARSASD
jgi:hypothetical protein